MIYDICVCVKCFYIFYTNYFKNTRTTHALLFFCFYILMPNFQNILLLKNTKLYLLYVYRNIRVLYLLIMLLSPIQGWRLVVHREKNILTHRRNINQNNLCLIMIIDYNTARVPCEYVVS